MAGDPKVAASGIEDDFEGLGGGSNHNITVVLGIHIVVDFDFGPGVGEFEWAEFGDEFFVERALEVFNEEFLFEGGLLDFLNWDGLEGEGSDEHDS